jgi:hypothetical protein
VAIEEIIACVSAEEVQAATENVERMVSEENRAVDGMLMLAYD